MNMSPTEIFRSSSFLIRRGATTAILTDTHYRSSPIVKVSPEIPRKLIIKVVRTSHNKSIATHFEKLVAKFYSEPTNEMIVGAFAEETQLKKKTKAGHIAAVHILLHSAHCFLDVHKTHTSYIIHLLKCVY